jgi:hypothetical protein
MQSKTIAGIFVDNIADSSNPELNLSDALATEKGARDIASQMIAASQTVSIQAVPCEVDAVLYNEDDLDKFGLKSSAFIGGIKCTPIYSAHELGRGGSGWVFPVDPHIKYYPIIGELVPVVTFGGQSYYYPPINSKNNVNHNAMAKITAKSGTGKYDKSKIKAFLSGGRDKDAFEVSEFPRPVKQYPGDWAINGRNDQSIRIGKAAEQDGTSYSVMKFRIAKEEKKAKNLFLPLEENPNEDVASIYMMRNEDLELNVIPKVDDETTPVNFSGEQILIDSKKLIFNSKLGGNINIFSGKNFNFVARNTVNLVGEYIRIGDVNVDKMQSAVMGELLCEFLAELLQEINRFAGKVSGATGIGNIGITVPIPALMGAGSGLQAYISEHTKESLQKRLLSGNIKLSRRKRNLKRGLREGIGNG